MDVKQSVLELLKQQKKVTASEVAKTLNIPKSEATQALKELKAEGHLKATGRNYRLAV